uniref:RRM domain-containing protein n=1 Tax=Glossina palpalis gambiensis TaxID=67801 RepID=A0A1B0BP51_9MUSC
MPPYKRNKPPKIPEPPQESSRNSAEDKVVSGQLEKKIKKQKQASKPIKNRGVVFIKHLPHGFFEEQMRHYFSQFGDVTPRPRFNVFVASLAPLRSSLRQITASLVPIDVLSSKGVLGLNILLIANHEVYMLGAFRKLNEHSNSVGFTETFLHGSLNKHSL